MRLLQTIIILSIILSSCNNEKTKNTTIDKPVEVSAPEAPVVSEELRYPYNLHTIWAFDFIEKVYCEFIGIQNDTAFLRIPDSEYLTQSMGTTGAYEYMIAATFTITELKGIEFVNFDFDYGDHAEPGTYTRQHYIDEIEYNKNLNK